MALAPSCTFATTWPTKDAAQAALATYLDTEEGRKPGQTFKTVPILDGWGVRVFKAGWVASRHLWEPGK